MEKRFLLTCLLGVGACFLVLTASVHAQKTYVGSEICADCHELEYTNFTKYAKKAHSDRSVKIMSPKLTRQELEECYTCHTTGFGQPGGFKSFSETPELGHAGCEVCHGPGSAHVDYGGDPTEIKGDLTIQDCESCHNQERIQAFNYKPLLFGGAH